MPSRPTGPPGAPFQQTASANRLRSELRACAAEFRARYLVHALAAHFGERVAVGRATSFARAPQWQNVLGFGIGEKATHGASAGVQSLAVYVRHKQPLADVPRRYRIPRTIAGYPTDVVQVGGIRCLARSRRKCLMDPRVRQPRPVPAGVSIGGGTNSAGTLGWLVSDSEGILYVLGNYHVLADMRHGSCWALFQPGKGDGTQDATAEIGRYDRGVPLDFSSRAQNLMDAALARVRNGKVVPWLCGLGRLHGAARPKSGTNVRKFGRTTKISNGVVWHEECDVVVDYPGGRKARFVRQVYIQPITFDVPRRPFASPGDSGAIVVTDKFKACAVLFAAGALGGAYATPVHRILRRLKASLVLK